MDRYLKILTYLNQRLQKIEKEKDEKRFEEMLEDVAMDLRIKAEQGRRSADGVGKAIRVKARTRSGANEVSGYEVWLAPKVAMDIESARERFRISSSPTGELDLPPGNYAFWARKGETATGQVTKKIGGQGEGQIEVDLEVP